jgi:hypothetical protein
MNRGFEMKEYVFRWPLEPPGVVTDEFSVDPGGPLVVSVRGDRIEIRAWAIENEKEQLQQQATALASNLANTLGVQYHAAIKLRPPVAETYHVEPGSLRKDVEGSIGINAGASMTAALGALDASGNVIDSPEMRREEQRRQTRRRSLHLAARACEDPALREMLQYRAQYESDPLGRLHHLYDILQVAERVHQGRKEAADKLHLPKDDLGELARIANNPNLTNARHPGESPRHYPASAEETATCERVADAIIDAQAAA